jgi:hypothetical protein
MNAALPHMYRHMLSRLMGPSPSGKVLKRTADRVSFCSNNLKRHSANSFLHQQGQGLGCSFHCQSLPVQKPYLAHVLHVMRQGGRQGSDPSPLHLQGFSSILDVPTQLQQGLNHQASVLSLHWCTSLQSRRRRALHNA